MEEIIIKNIEQIKPAAKIISEWLNEYNIICLYGEMGSGKTTLIKNICAIIQTEDYVTSPSFSIVNEYYSKKHGKIYHFDLYRINKLSEVLDIGIEDYFSEKDCKIFIEWPELIESLLPPDVLKIRIIEQDGIRIVSKVKS